MVVVAMVVVKVVGEMKALTTCSQRYKNILIKFD